MTDLYVDMFLDFCFSNFDFEGYKKAPLYRSLPLCIIDCIYSLRARYFDTTIPVVERYARKYMNGNMRSYSDTLTDFINYVDNEGGCNRFSVVVLNNRQNLSGRIKSEVCYELATKLRDYLEIETIDDFKSYRKPELLELVIRSVKGMGDAGTNYLFMLAGDPNRCKPDIHIHRCITEACGHDITNLECQELFNKAIKEIHSKYPEITVRDMDNIIWQKYQIRASK